jgi:hypothetical protein
MILTHADHPLQQGLKVMKAAKAIFAHAERRSLTNGAAAAMTVGGSKFS